MAANLERIDVRQLNADDLEVIDTYCEKFENSWLDSKPLSIANLVKDVEPELQKYLLCELIKLDIDYRRRNGEKPEERDYQSRFTQTDAITGAFQCETRGLLNQKLLHLSNDYEVIELLAGGGLGEIYIALDKKLNRRVAIKVPKNRNAKSHECMRLRQEAKITCQLKHPNIIPVYASRFENDGWPCYAMQLIEGQTLRDEVRAFHTTYSTKKKYYEFEFRRLLRCFISVCNAVAYAHTKNVIHRDIKPGNIMLGSFGETFLIDWGLAKQLSETNLQTEEEEPQELESETWKGGYTDDTATTMPGQPIGTPEFASPEQLTGRIKQQDYRTDIYSLGATLFFILTNRKPKVSANLLANRLNVSPSESTLQSDASIPPELSAICAKAMAFAREDRFQSASEFADELERYLADEAVTVARGSRLTQLRRWSNKNPRWFSGILTGVTVALAALSISAVLLSQKNSQLSHANHSLTRSNTQLSKSRKKTSEVLKAVTDQTMKEFLGRKSSLNSQDESFLNQLLNEYLSFADSFDDDSMSSVIKLEANFKIAQLYRLLGKTPQAVETLNDSLNIIDNFDGELTPQMRTFEATALGQSGELMFRLGKRKQGIQRLLKSKDRFEQLCDDLPEDDGKKRCLAQSRFSLGVIHIEMNQLQDAATQLETAIETYEKLRQNDQTNKIYLKSLSNSYTNLGIAYAAMGKSNRAIHQYETALEIQDQLNATGFDNLDFKLESMKTLLALANVQKRLKLPEARKSFETVIENTTKLTQQYPSLPVNFVTLARAHQFLGQMLLFGSEKEQSVEHNRLAVEAATAAVALEPNLEKYQYTLFTSQMSFGVALRIAKDYDRSDEVYQDCLELGHKLSVKFGGLKNRIGLARAHFAYSLLKKVQALTDEQAAHLVRAQQILASKVTADSTSAKKLMQSIKDELDALSELN